jgi:nicotinate-nucleotide adenylyltransferase
MPSQRHRPERLGVLGGTFDPPHCGHVVAASACREALPLDRVLFVVANDPWQKSPRRQVSAAEDRLAMVEAAVARLEGAEVSRIELERGGPSYTVDTVEALAASARSRGEPEPEQFLIVGADVADTLPTWHRAAALPGLVTLVVVGRPGGAGPSAPPGWRLELVPGDLAVSSSQVRERVAAGLDIADLVPEAVERYIAAHNLYAVPR